MLVVHDGWCHRAIVINNGKLFAFHQKDYNAYTFMRIRRGVMFRGRFLSIFDAKLIDRKRTYIKVANKQLHLFTRSDGY